MHVWLCCLIVEPWVSIGSVWGGNTTSVNCETRVMCLDRPRTIFFYVHYLQFVCFLKHMDVQL